jgi:sec-independent protein translocase protein TatC
VSKFRKAQTGMTLAEHLAEVRHRFFVCAITVTIVGIAAWIFYNPVLHFLAEPYCRAAPRHCTFLVTNPLDGLTLRFKISVYGGIFFSSPVIFWQAWRFITPGLKAKERRYAIPFVSASIVFFGAGVVVAYFIFAQAIQWLQSIGGKSLVSHYNPNQYLGLFLLTMLIFGITFLFPVVLVAIELAGLVTPGQLLHAWRYAIIAIVVASAVFTPSGDPISMLVLAAPLAAFYFMAIGIGKLLKK